RGITTVSAARTSTVSDVSAVECATLAAGSGDCESRNMWRYASSTDHLWRPAPVSRAAQSSAALPQCRLDAGARVRGLQADQLSREAEGKSVGRAAAGCASLVEREAVLRDGGAQPGDADQDRTVSRHTARRPTRRIRRGAVTPARRSPARDVREHQAADRARVGASAEGNLRGVQ